MGWGSSGRSPIAPQPRRAAVLALALFLTMWLPAIVMPAAEVWNGPSLTFTQAAGADWTEPTNQDRITPNVWLTRGALQGLFNVTQESAYTHSNSPADTEWAYGALTNYALLTYTNWEAWYGGNTGGGPRSTLGKDAVLHLISDDVYIGIRFTVWGSAVGGFAYERSTPLLGIQSATQAGSVLAFTWNSVPDREYQVQHLADLTSTNWTDLGGPITATNWTATATDSLGPDPRRFYRVIRLP